MIEYICDHDDNVQHQVCQIIHIPIVEEVIHVTVTSLPLNELTSCLIPDENEAISE